MNIQLINDLISFLQELKNKDIICFDDLNDQYCVFCAGTDHDTDCLTNQTDALLKRLGGELQSKLFVRRGE